MSRTIEALKILHEKKPKTYEQFARLFWPDSDMFTRVTNCGYGSRRGTGVWLCTGSFLGKLRKAGLIKKINYTAQLAELTEKGLTLIKENSKSEQWAKICDNRQKDEDGFYPD